MKIFSVTFLLLSTSFLLHQLNIFTNQGAILLESGVSYVVEGAKTTWKYSLSFIEDSHENKLNKMKREKEKRDLERKIRIEEIEDELIEGQSIVDKSMPNYNNLLMMFGNEIPKQYETATQIDMMKGTIFVSESLMSLASIVKEETGKKLQEMNLKYFVDKMLEREIYMDTLIMFYEQNVKHYYLTNTIDGGRYQTDQSKMILQQAFENYESAWNMNLANDFLRLAQNQTSNLTYIDYDIVSQKIMIMNEPVTETHDDFPEKSRETRHKRNSINLVEQDPKCKTRPYHHERDSVWKTYDKY
jgi:hypothetical protein